jgi:transposase
MTTVTFEFSEDWGNTTFSCGLDVHKYQLAVAVFAKDDAGHEFLKSEIFGTDASALRAFFAFITPYKPAKIGMEATNVYHHVIATFLENEKGTAGWPYEVIVFHPADATGIPGRHKHDRADAAMIAKLLAAGLLKSGRPIIEALEDMRGIFRVAGCLECDRTTLKNRIKKQLDRAGFRPQNFNLNLDWARDLVHHVVTNEGSIRDVFSSFGVEGSPTAQHASVFARNHHKFDSYMDIVLSHGERALVNQDLVELEFKSARLALLAVEIDGIITTRPGLKIAIENLASIPGLTPYSAAWLVAETGHAAKYQNVKRFLSYCGCCPRTVASADRVYSAHVNRHSNPYARTILFNAARVVTYLVKKDSELKQYAARVALRKKGRGMAIVACIVAAKIGRIAYAIMRDGTSFAVDKGCNVHSPVHGDRGLLTVADKKELRKARNYLRRIAEIDVMGSTIKNNARYFADALDSALREN